MAKMRQYDSNTRRKANKQYHQLTRNILDKHRFSYVGIITEVIDANWCKVKLVPSVSFNEFEREVGYTKNTLSNPIIKVFKPVDVTIALDDVVLVVFTDYNFRKTILDIMKGKAKSSQFKETDQTQHSMNFGIITNKLL